MASASVLLPDPEGPTTSIVWPAGSSNDDAVQGQAIGAPMADREVARLERPRLTVGGRQSGNPSSTPARLSERCRTTDPPATITTAEIAMKTKRTAWTTGSTSA